MEQNFLKYHLLPAEHVAKLYKQIGVRRNAQHLLKKMAYMC